MLSNNENKKKIALIIYSLGIGGAEKVLADLSLILAKQHQVTLIVFDTYKIVYPYNGELIDINLPSVGSALGKLINITRRSWRLRKLFQQYQFDHTISFMEHANFPALLAARKHSIIVSNHCNPKMFSRMEWLFSRWLYPQAKKVVAVSAAGAAIFREYAKLDNVTYLHNPVDLDAIARKSQFDSNTKILLPPDREYIIAVGRLEKVKNFTSLIQAFQQANIVQRYDLLILGEGAEREVLQAQIRQSGVAAHIHLAGFIENPYPYIKHAKCLVLTSLHEGFPVVIAEALATSCPVIATRCETGPEEIIEHGKNGLLVPVNDNEALAAAMRQLLLDEAFYQTIKRQTQQTVQHLNLPEMAKQWLAL